MKQVTIYEAKTHLSRLIELALAGEEVIIAKGRRPLVKLEVLPHLRKRKSGGAKGILVSMSTDFNEPLRDFEEYMSP
jgi:antitoxin (DNA-binding transcriptional repressor) of toxin-antitoxin stability system